MLEANHTSVHCVTKVSAKPATCSCIIVVFTATHDHITDHFTVEYCLRLFKTLFIFTLLQSDTRVDIV